VKMTKFKMDVSDGKVRCGLCGEMIKRGDQMVSIFTKEDEGKDFWYHIGCAIGFLLDLMDTHEAWWEYHLTRCERCGKEFGLEEGQSQYRVVALCVDCAKEFEEEFLK